MLETLITSKTRLKLLIKFFLNSDNRSYLRGLESEFGESSNAIRIELNRFEEAGLLMSFSEGNKKIYQANKAHTIFKDIHSILLKFVGIDAIIERVLCRIGELHSAYITGAFAKGIDASEIELLLVGNTLDEAYATGLIEKAEKAVKRKIHLTIISIENLQAFLSNNTHLLIWKQE